MQSTKSPRVNLQIGQVFKKLRELTSVGLTLISCVFILHILVYSALVVYGDWGGIALIIGIITGPVLVIMAAIASALSSSWEIFYKIIFHVIATIVTLFAGSFISSKTVKA